MYSHMCLVLRTRISLSRLALHRRRRYLCLISRAAGDHLAMSTVKRIVAPRQLLAPVLALAAPAQADVAGKRSTSEAARPRFARGTAVEVRHRLERAPLSGRWMVVFVRATVVDSSVSGTTNDDRYIVPYSETAQSGRRMACVPAANVREARPTTTPAAGAAKRKSTEDGASCKKAMDALLRYMGE